MLGPGKEFGFAVLRIGRGGFLKRDIDVGLGVDGDLHFVASVTMRRMQSTERSSPRRPPCWHESPEASAPDRTTF